MNGFGIAIAGSAGTKTPLEATQAAGLEGSIDARLPGLGTDPDDGGSHCPVAVSADLTLLQQMIVEILDSAALQRRPVKEWRRLYRSFFAFFEPNGSADAGERAAWEIATKVFNTNLIAICNRTAQVVPMTFQDFVDGVDSFRHDGLREGAQRDIAWQPKKILLLMSSMIGRVLAGWQADAHPETHSNTELFPLRDFLIAENRKASFLGYVFDYDPRFSIREFEAAGLKPVMPAFPQFASALTENGLSWCECCPTRAPKDPPLLRAHFLKPLRMPAPREALSSVYFTVLNPSTPRADGCSEEIVGPDFDSSSTELDALSFRPSASGEVKLAKTEKLFELALTRSLIICGPQRADSSTACRIGKTLGRTRVEEFVIERFFVLGFRNGHGSEPWLERTGSASPGLALEKIKKARKQFAHWKKVSTFFFKVGQSQAMGIPGASVRQEALQPRNSSFFLTLLGSPIYAPLMRAVLASDAGKWLLDDFELHAFARNLSTGLGRILSEGGDTIVRCADSLPDPQQKAVFLFECAVGILRFSSRGHKNAKRPANLEKAEEFLRQHYENAYGISLRSAPSVLETDRNAQAARLAESKKPFEAIEKTIISLMNEPLTRKVAQPLATALEALPETFDIQSGPAIPRIRLETTIAFRESVEKLRAFLTSRKSPGSVTPSSSREFLAACVELRACLEAGRTEEAMAKSNTLFAGLNEARKQALAPFFNELACSILQEIEQRLSRGENRTATVLARNSKRFMQSTGLRIDFEELLPAVVGDVQAVEPALMSEPPTQARVSEAETLLREYADELNMAENRLELQFLQAV
jgi:hypothetical protein